MATSNRWVIGGVGSAALIFIIAAVFGFILLPIWQHNITFATLWNTICSVAGQPQPAPAAQVIEPSYTLTNVVLTPGIPNPNATTVGRGATLALRCTMCHGAQGLSEANSPNLAGQDDQAIFKQLIDFQTGARASAIMAPLVHGLTDQQAHDLATYYAYLPRPPWAHANAAAPAIVAQGAPMRGIAPCAACHGSIAHKPGTPRLEGEPVAYLRAQMLAFKNSSRHNDIQEQMRNIARSMTDQEIEASARYYGD